MTLLGAAMDTEVVVAEMGARRAGDVTLLCAIARPTSWSSRTSASRTSRSSGRGSGSWRPRPSRSTRCGADGVAVLNADDPVVSAFADRVRGEVVTFGVSASAEVRAENVVLGADGRASFRWCTASSSAPVSLGVPGEHMVSNALAAIGGGAVARRPARRRAPPRWRTPPCRTGGWRRSRPTRRRARRERRLQREPRVGGGRAQGGAVDGGRGPPHRGAGHDGRARARSPCRSTSASASWRRGCAWTA